MKPKIIETIVRKRFDFASTQFRLDTCTPTTLIACGSAAVTDPRFNNKSNNDTHDGIMAPDKFDLVGNSRYAQYCRNVIESSYSNNISDGSNSTEPTTTEPTTSETE